jgi:hypothetical protein
MQFNDVQLSTLFSNGTNDREQLQNARENPIQAQSKSNIENLLDLEIGGATEEVAPSPTVPRNPSSILDDLGSLSISTSPVVAPPSASPPLTTAPAQPASNMNDLLGIFDAPVQNGGGLNGGNVWDAPQNNAPSTQKTKTNEDILGLF